MVVVADIWCIILGESKNGVILTMASNTSSTLLVCFFLDSSDTMLEF